ncbi:hypothetical protein HPG69_016425 [Diceros bicornis minor]|uniref:Immunoglobulin V-set domain-containing protein n=1 Tax=Diceros bicornis minor TaxID=77932 RepID=A0A7J7EFV2_DICBM|nr:hypothetical protein HPG69_016425 [Diceros bicornis minor]
MDEKIILEMQRHTGAGVSQSPRHRITERGQAVSPGCDPISDHAPLYWYRQTLEQGLEFLIHFFNKNATNMSGMPNDWFSAERRKGSSSTLKIQPTEQGNSALYLCASYSAIAWHSHPLSVHKLHTPSP